MLIFIKTFFVIIILYENFNNFKLIIKFKLAFTNDLTITIKKYNSLPLAKYIYITKNQSPELPGFDINILKYLVLFIFYYFIQF